MNREDALKAVKWSLCKGKVKCCFQHLMKEVAEAYTQEVTSPRSHRETVEEQSPGLLILGPELFPNLMLP